jgi:uncharacterized protein YprB with RNaseH-like and TPR domain
VRVVLDIETTGLDPRVHEVVAVGFTPADEFRPTVLVRHPNEPEAHFISRADRLLGDCCSEVSVVGYNVWFDVDFLKRRGSSLLFTDVFDLMKAATEELGFRPRLKTAARRLLGEVPTDVDGSEVPRLWKVGALDTIRFHLYKDVERTFNLLKYFERRWELEKGKALGGGIQEA